ncbi:HB2L protein, partial [Sakesphorus luctuosus]|nr:HB2L protein [Sakesphorus luctuosus]
SGVLQELRQGECHFINGTDRMRFVQRYSYNRQQYMHFDSDVGHFVGDTPYGEEFASEVNRKAGFMAYIRAAMDTLCRHNYEINAPFSVNHRGIPSHSKSIPRPSQ